jgi:transposase
MAEWARDHVGLHFIPPGDPESKGIVENLCGYAQRDLAVPLLTDAAITGTPVDVRAANAAARAGCVEVNAAVHAEIMAAAAHRT